MWNLPHLIAIWSSPTLIWLNAMTPFHESDGSIPSVLRA